MDRKSRADRPTPPIAKIIEAAEQFAPAHAAEIEASTIAMAELRDWQADEADSRPWSIRFMTARDGLSLDIVSPDGSRRELYVELENGVLRVAVYTSSDAPDLILGVTADGACVSSNQVADPWLTATAKGLKACPNPFTQGKP